MFSPQLRQSLVVSGIGATELPLDLVRSVNPRIMPVAWVSQRVHDLLYYEGADERLSSSQGIFCQDDPADM